MTVRPARVPTRLLKSLADRLITSPLARWTWQGQGDAIFKGELPDLRPADRDAVREMMAGRYLLASKLIETGGTSPFAVEVEHQDWWNNLHGFSWLRHFREVRDPGQRYFARTLVLDWIGREGQFERDSWTLTLTAQRILNWLRHLPLLVDGATPEQARTIRRNLATQVQSLRLRHRLARDPADTLFAAIGLLGAAIAEEDVGQVDLRVARLDALLSEEIDADGLHLSRNPRLHLAVLTELAGLRRAAGRYSSPAMADLSARIDRMHEALDVITLSTGEPVYFNGCGQVPHDVLVAVQAHGPGARRYSRLLGGYGILHDGETMVVADSGQRPPDAFAGEMHASALAFEFAHGSELIVGSCGPAPSDLPDSRALFRQGIAHSAPTIDAEDALPRSRGLFPATPPQPEMELDPAQHALALRTSGYAARFGAEVERRLTLLSNGTTLVGQDRIVPVGTPQGLLAIRFHLAPGVAVRRSGGEGIVRLDLPDGSVWSFLWEGARFREEDSVRQSAYLGFHRTRQLVLEADVTPECEVAWIFTKEQH